MKQIILIALSSVLAFLPPVSLARSPSANEIQMKRDGEKQKTFIEKVAQQAKDKDTASILSEYEPSVIKAIGETTIVNNLQTTVFPFFATYVKLYKYDQFTKAVLPDGRSGIWHYTYIAGDSEKMMPFRIAIMDTSNGPKILNIVVNECVKDRHPICE